MDMDIGIDIGMDIGIDIDIAMDRGIDTLHIFHQFIAFIFQMGKPT